MIHLATIPVDNTSVNPARSFGTAVFVGSRRLTQLWVFIVFPLVGAVLGVLVWLLVHDERLEDTMFGGQPGLVAARDRAAGVAGQVEDRLELIALVAGRSLTGRRQRAVLLVPLGGLLGLLPLPDGGERLRAGGRRRRSAARRRRTCPAASRQPGGATPCVLARMATKICAFSSP